jgi:rhamnosyltransferase subunit B
VGKRIVLTSVGSFGDLHPFISVSLALNARGLDSVIATSEAYRQKIEREGVSFRPVAPGPDQLLEDTGLTLGDIVRKIMQSGTKFIIEKVVMPYVERSYEKPLRGHARR